MAAKAKEARDEGEIKLVSAMEELNIAVTAEPTNKRVIGGKIRKVEVAFEKVQRVHSQYCQKAKIGLTSTDSTEYLGDWSSSRQKVCQLLGILLVKTVMNQRLRNLPATWRVSNSSSWLTLRGKWLL